LEPDDLQGPFQPKPFSDSVLVLEIPQAPRRSPQLAVLSKGLERHFLCVPWPCCACSPASRFCSGLGNLSQATGAIVFGNPWVPPPQPAFVLRSQPGASPAAHKALAPVFTCMGCRFYTTQQPYLTSLSSSDILAF